MEKILINIVSLNLSPLKDHLEVLERLAQASEEITFTSFENLESLNEFKSSNTNILYIFNVKDKSSFVEVAKTLKSLKKGKNPFKAIAFFDQYNEKAENILLNQGCSNILKTNSSSKNLELKVKMLVRSLLKKIQEKDGDLEYRKIEERESGENSYIRNQRSSLNIEQEESFLFDDVGEADLSSLEENKEFKDSKFKVSLEERQAQGLVEYINKAGEKGLLNLEDGELNIELEGLENTECRFESFSEDQVILDIKGGINLSEDEPLSLLVKFIYDKCKVEIELDGLVKNIEKYNSDSGYVTLDLKELSDGKLDYFISLYERRQESIDQFMALARGIA